MKQSSILLAGLAALGALGGESSFPNPRKTSKGSRIEFSKAELAWIRSLPKKEKKAAVEQLKARYRG